MRQHPVITDCHAWQYPDNKLFILLANLNPTAIAETEIFVLMYTKTEAWVFVQENPRSSSTKLVRQAVTKSPS